MFDRLAIIAQLYPKRILAATLALVIAAGYAAGSVFDVLKPFGFEDPASESIVARESLEKSAGVEPNPELTALVRTGEPVGTPTARAKVMRVAAVLKQEPEVKRVVTPYQPQGAVQISRDGKSAYILGFFNAGLEDKEKQEAARRLRGPVAKAGGTLGGFAMATEQVNKQVENDLRRAEAFAFPILFLISLLVFRSLVAASLPLMVGGLSIMGALLGLRLGAELTDLSIFAVNLVSGLGLGLAIDYSLFVVSRYREELARRGPGFEALQATMRTAGRTVVFSALTVAAALASLTIFPQRFLYSMGVGGSLVALFSGLIAITVLPAILAMLGNRVNALAPARLQRAAERDARTERSGFWYRLSQFVMRRPIPIATVATLLLLAAGTPFLRADFTMTDEQVLPTSASARQVGTVLKEEFNSDRTTPMILELRTESASRTEVSQKLQRYSQRLGEIDGVKTVAAPVPAGNGVQRLDLFIRPRQFSDAAQELVREIRDMKAPFPLRAGGAAPEFVDQRESVLAHIPIAGAILVTTTLLILFLMTGSVILPVKTLIMNLLTVSVAFGVLVFVFQDARFEDLLSYESRGALDLANPLLLFATAFGLSTDYGVFLLTRIKEARDAGAGETDSVAIGLERTGRIVTAAALLLCIAIGALAISKIVFIKEYGIGVAVAVLVDATIVRAFLVPALMRLLGKWNWWAPKPLRRLHERIGISEAEPSRA